MSSVCAYNAVKMRSFYWTHTFLQCPLFIELKLKLALKLC